MFRMRENVQRPTGVQNVYFQQLIYAQPSTVACDKTQLCFQPGRKAFAARVELRYSNYFPLYLRII